MHFFLLLAVTFSAASTALFCQFSQQSNTIPCFLDFVEDLAASLFTFKAFKRILSEATYNKYICPKKETTSVSIK